MKVLRFYVLCPVALKMKNIPSVKQRKKQRQSQQATEWLQQPLARWQRNVSPCTIILHHQWIHLPLLFGHWQNCCRKFTQTFGPGNLQTLWVVPGWLNFVPSSFQDMGVCANRLFVSVWLMAQKDFKLFYCQSCKSFVAACVLLACANSTFYLRIIQRKDWNLWQNYWYSR